MTILDLIKKTATIFNIESVLQDTNLNTITEASHDEVLNANSELNRLFELSKQVLSEIYSYVAKEVDVVVKSTNCQINKTLLGQICKVVLVKNKHGKVNYQLQDDKVIVEQDGEYIVRCIVAPNVKYLNKEINMLNGDISEDLLINGLNAYYCLTSGLFEEYNVYNARYIDGFSRLRNPKLFAMPCRSWHE